MVARARRALRPTSAIVVFAIAFLLMAGATSPGPSPIQDPVAIERVEGAGFDELLCLACVGTIIAAGGTSIGGFLITAAFYPELYSGCAFHCVRTFL